jgi:hypothetical protein
MTATKTANTNKATKVSTGLARLSYAHVWHPVAIGADSDPKASASIRIPKADNRTLSAIKSAVEAALEAGLAKKFGGKRPAKLKLPLRDGDVERPDDPVYAGMYFFNASSKTAPGIIDINKQEILDSGQVYSGCWARVSVNFYAFNTRGNTGVAAGLNHIMKVKDDEHLGGRGRAEDDFNDDFDVSAYMDDDDFLN